jgi:hypothetical protein
VQRRTPGERKPPGEAGDPERAGERRVDVCGNLDGRRITDQGSFRHPAVATETEAAAEDPDRPPVCGARDRLAARDVRQRWVSRVVATGGDSEVDGIDRRGQHLDGLALRLVGFTQLGRRTKCTNKRSLHAKNLDGATVRPRPEPGFAGREAMLARRCRKPEEGGSWGKHGFPHGL